MLERHDWITPTLGQIAWLEKPPLYYWQAIIAYKIFGISDWSARLPSAFDTFLLIFAVYWFLRRFRPTIALDGALICATSAGIVGFSRAASTDMPLTAMFSIALLAWYSWFEGGDKKHLAGFYVFLALAMLAKGPVAPFLAAAVIGITAAEQKSGKIFFRTLWIPGIAMFCAIGLPWYVLVQIRNPQFFHEFIIEHNLARFGSNLYHHPEPFWYYIPVTLLGWVPWTILAIAAVIWAVRCWRRPDADSLNSFLLIWIAVVVAFFSISQSKLPGYVLPALPAGALLVAQFVHNKSMEQASSRALVLIGGLHAALAGGLIFCALVVQYLVLQHHVPWGAAKVPLAASAVIAIGIFALLIKPGFRSWRIATLVPAIVALAMALRFGAEPLDETLSARPIARELAAFDPHHLPVAVFLTPRETEFGLAFYCNQIIDRYELGQIPAGEHLVVAAQGYPRGVAKAAGRRVVYLRNFAPQKLDFFYVPGR